MERIMIADPRNFRDKPGVFDPETTPEELRRRTWWSVWAFVGVVLWGLIVWAGIALAQWIGG